MKKVDYETRNAIERMEKDLNDCKAEMDAWKNVEVVTKKDGTPFKNIAQNFKNCSFGVKDWHISPYEKTMYVSYHCKGYHTASIECFSDFGYVNSDHPENIYIRPFGQKGYAFTVDEIVEEINKRIDYLNRRCGQLAKAIEQVDSLRSLLQGIDDSLREFENTNKALYYEACTAIKEMY